MKFTGKNIKASLGADRASAIIALYPEIGVAAPIPMETPRSRTKAFIFRHSGGGTRVEFLDQIARGRKHTRKALKDHQPLEQYLKDYIARREVSGWTCTKVTISKGWQEE